MLTNMVKTTSRSGGRPRSVCEGAEDVCPRDVGLGSHVGRLRAALPVLAGLDLGLVLLLPLHPPVLEPDLDLALGEAEGVGDLYAPPPGEIAVKVELLLQLQGLVSSVGLAAPLPL